MTIVCNINSMDINFVINKKYILRTKIQMSDDKKECIY